jgi:hypothetical protein
VQLSRGSLVLLAGLVILVGAGGVTVAARSGGGGDEPVRIEPVDGGAAADAAPGPPPPPRSVFETHQIVAYYGNPYSATMGILGEFEDRQELVRRLRAQADRHQALNPEKTVIPALHLIYAVAQADPGADGSYLIHMPDEMVEELIELTRANNMLLFIDLQNGRNNPVEEVTRVLKWLRNEHVHLALDPEFTLAPGENTRDDIGSLDGAVINQVQDLLQQVATEARIGNKVLIVHQFRPDMITNKSLIAQDHDRVDVVINMDGWGPPPGKLSKYEAHVTNEPVEYAGIKLFYRWDAPLLGETEIQGLTPRPNYIQYQ